MRSDFETITPIAVAAIGTIGDELTFTYPKVLEVMRLCTANEIAVLGVALFEVRSGGYAWKSLSTYDQQMGCGPKKRNEWADYVKANNVLAEEFIRLNPTSREDVYLLTTTSWREFCNLKK